MGSGSSKHPGWYPGEPATDISEDCATCRPPSPGRNFNCQEGGSSSNNGFARLVHDVDRTNRVERDIARLPAVELVGLEFIAHGAYCDVYSCKYRGWDVVAKRPRQDLPPAGRWAALDNLWSECECLQQLHHPNIIEAYGMCRVKHGQYSDADEGDVCLLLEQLAFGTVGHLFGTTMNVQKNLASLMQRSRKMKMVPFHRRLDRALELAMALDYIHRGSGVGSMMHRDIKSVNVGFAQNGSLKLMDFGLSKIVCPLGTKESDTFEMTGEVGSYRYMAPELVKHEPYNIKADIYSWAILSWEILAVERPYADITESTFVKKVVSGGERPPLKRSWPGELRNVLASAWHGDLSERPTAAEIVRALLVVRDELPARERRRPSLTAPLSNGTDDAGEGSSRRPSSVPSLRHETPPGSTGRVRPRLKRRGSDTDSGKERQSSRASGRLRWAFAGDGVPSGSSRRSFTFSVAARRRSSSSASRRLSWMGMRSSTCWSSMSSSDASKRGATTGSPDERRNLASLSPGVVTDPYLPSEAEVSSAPEAVQPSLAGSSASGEDENVILRHGDSLTTTEEGRSRSCAAPYQSITVREMIVNALARDAEGLHEDDRTPGKSVPDERCSPTGVDRSNEKLAASKEAEKDDVVCTLENKFNGRPHVAENSTNFTSARMMAVAAEHSGDVASTSSMMGVNERLLRQEPPRPQEQQQHARQKRNQDPNAIIKSTENSGRPKASKAAAMPSTGGQGTKRVPSLRKLFRSASLRSKGAEASAKAEADPPTEGDHTDASGRNPTE